MDVNIFDYQKESKSNPNLNFLEKKLDYQKKRKL